MRRVLLLAGLCFSCAHAEAPMRDDAEPVQAPADPKAVGEEMRQAQARADEAIRSAAESPGPLEARHRTGVFEVLEAMRPTFGPANAWLFNEREKKLRALAAALGAAVPVPAGVDVLAWDGFFGAVDAAEAALAGPGRAVAAGRTDSTVLGWTPRTPGRALRVEDTTRHLPPYVPYEGAPGMPDRAPRPVAAVHPAFTLHLVPLSALSARADLVRREQPGRLLGAVEAALVFAQDPARAGDTDDGKTEARALEALFGAAAPVDDAALAKALGASKATRHRGVLWLTLPADGAVPVRPAAEGVLAVHLTRGGGPSVELHVLP